MAQAALAISGEAAAGGGMENAGKRRAFRWLACGRPCLAMRRS
jgi:hypothetical protein